MTTKDEDIFALAHHHAAYFYKPPVGDKPMSIAFTEAELIAFAKAIQEKQREEDAKVCDDYPKRDPAEDGNGYWAAENCANTIRAKSPESDIDQATRTT